MLQFLYFITFFLTFTNGAKILCYFPNPSKSHVMLALPIAEELAQRGHQLTVVTNHKHGLGGPNYKEIVIKTKDLSENVVNQMNSGRAGKSVNFILDVIEEYKVISVETLKSPVFQKMMTNETFDLVFFINVFFNGYQLGIADHFKAPWVGLTPMGNIYPVRESLGVGSLASVVPSKFTTLKPSEMNFFARLQNLGANFMEYAITKYMSCKEKETYDELWPADEYRSYDEMKNNVSAMFLNGHWSESMNIRPTLPNEIDIGGIQIKEKPKALEAEVQKFLNDAKDGVIVWTFGSNLPISQIEPEKLKIMFKVLGGLKQKVIMRWELDDTSMLPKNFLGRKWLAQDSILAHKNVKLFVSHCGHGGAMEAMYHQVPIFGVPFFGDQDGNMEKARDDGWAIGIKLYDITEENFSEAINELLTNPKYKEKVKEMSEMYRSRPITALNEAVFWVEYTLKYYGAPHLSFGGRNLNFFQFYSLDAIGFVLAVIYLVIYIFKFIFRKLCCSPKAKVVDKKKKE